MTEQAAEAVNAVFGEIVTRTIEGMERMFTHQLRSMIKHLLEQKDIEPKVIEEVMAGLDNDRLEESYRVIALILSALPGNRRELSADDRRVLPRGGRRATDFDAAELDSPALLSMLAEAAAATGSGERRQCAFMRNLLAAEAV